MPFIGEPPTNAAPKFLIEKNKKNVTPMTAG